jgi:hypothetical protein
MNKTSMVTNVKTLFHIILFKENSPFFIIFSQIPVYTPPLVVSIAPAVASGRRRKQECP